MTKFAISFLFICSASLAFATPSIEGDWGTQQFVNGIQFDMTFSFHNNQLTLTNVCLMNGNSARAQISVPVSYDDQALTITQSQADHESNSGVSCDVSVVPGYMQYHVSGNTLTLSQPGNTQSMNLIRK